MKSLLKPSINWLLVFVPVAILLRIWPQFENETALFICSCLAVVPLAGGMGRATEELAEHPNSARAVYFLEAAIGVAIASRQTPNRVEGLRKPRFDPNLAAHLKPLSHSQRTLLILPATTVTSNGP